MAEPLKIYWDSCVWIGKINDEADKRVECDYWLAEAKAGNAQIWTSCLTLAEVFKRKCGKVAVSIDESLDAAFEDFMFEDFVVQIQVDSEIGIRARELLRRHPELLTRQSNILLIEHSEPTDE